jgi:hypothetical protein
MNNEPCCMEGHPLTAADLLKWKQREREIDRLEARIDQLLTFDANKERELTALDADNDRLRGLLRDWLRFDHADVPHLAAATRSALGTAVQPPAATDEKGRPLTYWGGLADNSSQPPAAPEICKHGAEANWCIACYGEPCRIMEYDGAWKCYTHNRQWGAISPVTGPCDGWTTPGSEP